MSVREAIRKWQANEITFNQARAELGLPPLSHENAGLLRKEFASFEDLRKKLDYGLGSIVIWLDAETPRIEEGESSFFVTSWDVAREDSERTVRRWTVGGEWVEVEAVDPEREEEEQLAFLIAKRLGR